MKEFGIINLNNFTWQLNIAIMGGAFSVFSLIYNDYYIYYGLVTFAFGVTMNIIHKFFEWYFREKGKGSKYYWITHAFNALVAIIWIATLIYIY